MGFPWFKNVIGLSVSDEELKSLDYPRTELCFHVTYRAVQTTSLLGAMFVAPIVSLFKQPRTLFALQNRCLTYAVYGMIPGLVLGPLMYYGRMKGQPEEGYLDRCYRLRRNKGQVRVDRYSILVAAIIGTAASTTLITEVRPVEGAVLGMFGARPFFILHLMGFPWFKNVIGLSVSDEELKSLDCPRTELYFHVTYRAVQTTSLLGAMFVAPIVSLFKQPRTLFALQNRCRTYAVYGLIPGLVLGPLMCYGRMKGQPEEGYLDRCYRLRRNKGQVRVDRFSMLGAAIGGTASATSLITAVRPVEGAVLGMLGGIFLAATTTKLLD